MVSNVLFWTYSRYQIAQIPYIDSVRPQVLTERDSLDEQQEVHCCKQREAEGVILTLQKRAEGQIKEGRLSDAAVNLNKVLSMQQKLYGRKHAKVAATLNTIGEVLSNMGEDYRYMSMSSLQRSLEMQQEIEPAGSEDTVNTVNNLWMLLNDENVRISISSEEGTATFQNFG